MEKSPTHMRRFLNDILGSLAALIVLRHKPVVVAVAGSVGKTSTKNAVAAALARTWRVRASAKNFNNELGVPLSVIGATRQPGRSPFAWLSVIVRAVRLAYGPVDPRYPKVLVLEMATDKPGDLAYLASIAPPDVAAETAVSEEHTEFLGDIDGVAKEEGTIVEALPPDGVAVLNADDPRVAAMLGRTRAKAVTYGFSEGADVRARNVVTESAMGAFFTRFDLEWRGKTRGVTLSGALGDGNVMAALAAAAVAVSMGIPLDHVPYGLGEYQPPPGRLRALPGVKKTLLIDDTYNSSPRAAELALRTLRDLPRQGGKRIAVLGDMLELGALTEEAHRRVGRQAAESGVDLLLGVGPRASELCGEARRAGMAEERVFHFHDAEEASHFLQDRIRSGDVILIKGSRGMHMERAVRDLMAEPERAEELLVSAENH